jgi:ElaB/YqjD/DUF883 family membrane-anchored ribosome-binding protein
MPNSKTTRESNDAQKGDSTTRRFAERMHEGVDQVAERGERLESRLHEGREHLDAEARRLHAGIVRLIRDNPWTAVGGSIAIGFLLSALRRRH